MENARDCRTSPAAHAPLLHIVKPMPQMVFNRVFAAIYLCAILTFLYYRVKTLISSSTLAYFSINLALLISEILLAFMWVNTQALRMSPVCRQEFPENVEKVLERSHFPGLDVFICTADPYKEPLIGVVNTAVSVMAYDYPTEKISVYISDDGGSALTLFAVMEAAKFASHWLPFCKKSNLADRSPEAYFNSNQSWSPEIEKIKVIITHRSTPLTIFCYWLTILVVVLAIRNLCKSIPNIKDIYQPHTFLENLLFALQAFKLKINKFAYQKY
uniref:Cellulose synthase-like protein G3 n=1 Tax=Rhizophora mucronata TaxID=61149 RepID=A0A2P2KHT2_RHIMU